MGIDFERPPAWRRYLRFWGSNAASDVDEELRFHLESRIAELVAEGWSEEDARRATRERFGDFEAIRLRCRELSEERERSMRRSEWLAEIGQDLRYGWRTMLRAPAFTAVAVLSLAVGIGANTAIFGLLHKIVLEKLPVPDPDRLVQITIQMPDMSGHFSQPFTDDQLNAIQGMRGVTFSNFSGASLQIAVGEDKSPYGFEGVAGSFFSLVGVRPLQGRLITPEDDRTSAQVVVISESLWKHYWPGETSAVGKVMRINDVPFTVIGVTPASFQGVVAFGVFNAAIPLTTMRQIQPDRRNAGEPMSAPSVDWTKGCRRPRSARSCTSA
jgi:hypothetical protein